MSVYLRQHAWGMRACLLMTALVATLTLMAWQARPSQAYYERVFCSAYFPSGATCSWGEYHHLAKVQAQTLADNYDRVCANGVDSGGSPVSGWACGYRMTTKYMQGIGAYAAIHNGDPDSFYMYGVALF